jgi:quercetin dioxygenase-like cupin family protein
MLLATNAADRCRACSSHHNSARQGWVTWVEPGSQHGLHEHDHSEQVYVVVRGRGVMIVDDESLEIEAGSAILIPAGAKHTIRNTGIEPLEYISATPPFPAEISGTHGSRDTSGAPPAATPDQRNEPLVAVPTRGRAPRNTECPLAICTRRGSSR